MVGRALAGRFRELGHDVVIGTRDVEQTVSRVESDGFGAPAFAEWHKDNPEVRLLPFPKAGAHAEVVVNATAGVKALSALAAVGMANLSGKVLVDLALPLDFSNGLPPKLLVANTDSLGEQIQRAYPQARVVKTLNTMFVRIMIEPARIPGRHNIFLAGDDLDAKETVKGLLRGFGWRDEVMIDLGGIQSARATEMYMQLYFALVGALGHFDFNISVEQKPQGGQDAEPVLAGLNHSLDDAVS